MTNVKVIAPCNIGGEDKWPGDVATVETEGELARLIHYGQVETIDLPKHADKSAPAKKETKA